jgi:hypothetical protein
MYEYLDLQKLKHFGGGSTALPAKTLIQILINFFGTLKVNLGNIKIL